MYSAVIVGMDKDVALHNTLAMKPGPSVEDVFLSFTWIEAIGGDF